MEKILKLYTYVDGTNDTPFPSADEQVIIGSFTYTANRMGGAPTITATVKHRLCLDDLWNDKVYAEFNGEKYFVINTPSSSKSNDDTRYEHDLELLSEREILNHVYFIDAVQGDSDTDVYKSNSTKVLFYGDIEQFVGRLNASMSYSGLSYTAVIDEGIASEEKQVSFEDKYILEALQEAFNVFEVPYYFVGHTIHFGFTENAITTVLKYGHDRSFLSISKDNANYAIINRITGVGSSDNIPYYYPNSTPKGDLSVEVVTGEHLVDGNFKVDDALKFSERVSLQQNITYLGKDDPYEDLDYNKHWELDGVEYNLNDLGLSYVIMSGRFPEVGDKIKQVQVEGTYITPSQNLMPSKYRETKGAERFYNAINNTYSDGEGGYYEFENEYSENNPREGITDFENIKPTITGITNAAGQRIDSFIQFAYDTNDSDEVDSEGNYLHPYFFAKLRRTNGTYGFNLFDHAIESQTMQISFTSGVCGACNFEIAVGDETQKNLVQVDASGNLMRDENGYVLCGREDLQHPQTPQDRQNDTQNYEVWIALRKDDTTYPQVMPNVNYNYKPSTNDTFVILGISLPQAYILRAEDELEKSLIKYMWMNNVEKFTFSAKFSRIFFQENPYVLAELNENARVIIEYNGKQHTLYINSYTYKMDSGSPLPEIEIELVDTLAVGQNTLQTQLDSVKQDILSTIGGADFLKQGLKYFLRKDKPDTSKYLLTLLGGANFGNYIQNISVGRIVHDGELELFRLILRENLQLAGDIKSDNFTQGAFGTGYGLLKQDTSGHSYLEVDNLFVRIKAFFTELEIKKLSYAGGNFIFSPAGITLSEVQEFDSYYRCFFTNNDGSTETENLFRVNDLVLSQTFNIKTGVYENVSNRRYWRAVVFVGDNYIDLSKTDCEANSDIPQAGDAVVCLGNKSDRTRQNAIIIYVYGDDSPSIVQYQGIDTYSLSGKDKTKISPNGNVFTGSFKFASTGKDVEESINDMQTSVDEVTENIEFIQAVAGDIEDLKKQVDGAIETWFYSPVPTLENAPAVDWTTTELKNQHLGDLYYDGNGKAYRFQKDGSNYVWQIITDTDITTALANAQKAQDTADGKRRVFVTQPTSSSVYDVGDLWVNATYGSTYNNDLLRCITAKASGQAFSINHWTKASDYTNDDKANQAIEEAANAKQEAQDAKDRLDDWADDGVISPTEKQGLKDEMARIKGDYDEINAGYSKYGLGTPSSYNSAYNSYMSVLSTLSASTPEVITIPSYFASRQTTYYTQRTNALNAIATAAKDYVDGLGDTVTETVMEAVDDKITLAVNTAVEDAEGNIMQTMESRLEVVEGEISSKVSETTFTQEKASILNTAQGYANNALTSAKQDAANKYATISTMNTMSTRIDQLSDSISLKADSSTVTSLVNDYGDLQEHVADLETRVNSAELKITPDAIVSTVSSNLQMGYANMMEMTGNFGDSIPSVLVNNGGGINLDTSVKYEGYNTIRTYVGNGFYYNKSIYLEKDTEYCYSAMVKGSKSYTAAWNMFLHMQSYNSSGVNTGVNVVKSSITLVANQWTLVYRVFKLYGDSTGTIRPFIYDPTYGGTVNIAFMCISKGNFPMFAYDSAPQESKSAMVQTANGFTFYGKTFDIKASIMTAENIAALNITTGKLTVTTGAKIGGWTVNGNALTCSQQAGAKIKVEPSGTRFLRINDTSTLMEMRADGVVGLSIYTQDTTGKCVTLIAQTGGIAMESHGNMELEARQGESIKLNGDVRVQGLALGTSIVGSNYTVPYNVSFISIQYGCTITLPANPPTGRMVICAARTADTITYQGNGKKIWRGAGISTSVRDEIDNCWNIFIYDSQRWVNIRLQNAE